MEGSGNEEIKVSVRKRDKIVKKRIESIWSVNLGEKYLIETMVSKFK